jgi:hypothetical protein
MRQAKETNEVSSEKPNERIKFSGTKILVLFNYFTIQFHMYRFNSKIMKLKNRRTVAPSLHPSVLV